jgi:hypothetical protein
MPNATLQETGGTAEQFRDVQKAACRRSRTRAYSRRIPRTIGAWWIEEHLPQFCMVVRVQVEPSGESLPRRYRYSRVL